MSQMVVLVVDNPDYCALIVRAWEKVGVTGVTILESTGLGHMHRAGLRDELSLEALRGLFKSDEVHHRTIFSVVEHQSTVNKMIAIAQQVAGNLDQPDTGFMFVVPVTQVYGLGKRQTNLQHVHADGVDL